jgi:hypothetical protein
MIHFYLFQKNSIIVVSDHSKDKIKAKYGPIFEIVNSVKDKSSLEIVKQRVSKSYNRCSFIEDFYKEKVFTEESRERIRQSKLGKPRPDWVREKISSKMKGKSNFEGKRHREGSKRLTSDSMMGNENVKDKKWIYNPTLDVEKRVNNVLEAPEGFRTGRDPELVNGYLLSRNQ